MHPIQTWCRAILAASRARNPFGCVRPLVLQPEGQQQPAKDALHDLALARVGASRLRVPGGLAPGLRRADDHGAVLLRPVGMPLRAAEAHVGQIVRTNRLAKAPRWSATPRAPPGRRPRPCARSWRLGRGASRSPRPAPSHTTAAETRRRSPGDCTGQCLWPVAVSLPRAACCCGWRPPCHRGSRTAPRVAAAGRPAPAPPP